MGSAPPLLQITANLSALVVHRYPQLRTQVNEHVVKLLREYTVPLREFICNVIKIELAYINTNHPHFYGGGSVFDTMNPQGMSSQGHPQVHAHSPFTGGAGGLQSDKTGHS